MADLWRFWIEQLVASQEKQHWTLNYRFRNTKSTQMMNSNDELME